MHYALLENGVVVNVIWLYEGNAGEFAGAVATGGAAVHIGDTYEDGAFYRAGERVKRPEEELAEALEILGVSVHG